MITLPKEWANSVGLNKNDTVGIQVQPDGTLLMYPKGTVPTPKRSTKVIDITDVKDQELFYQQLVGAYIAGHSMILIKSSTPMSNAVASTVSDFVQTSIGPEMIEADETHMLVANLIEHDAIDPRKIIKRMVLLVKNMISDMFTAASTGNVDLIADMRERDVEVDRIYWLIHRQCNICQRDATAPHRTRIPLSEMTTCLALSIVLESLGDHLTAVSDCFLILKECDAKDRADKDAKKAGQTLNDLLSKAMRSWNETDPVLAGQAIQEAEEMIKEAGETLRSNISGGGDYVPTREIVQISVRRIAGYCKEIAEFTFNTNTE